MTALQTIPARRGKAALLAKGQAIRIINTHGNQVVDTWAFNAGDLRECMGMEHCRVCREACRKCEEACQNLLDVVRA